MIRNYVTACWFSSSPHAAVIRETSHQKCYEKNTYIGVGVPVMPFGAWINRLTKAHYTDDQFKDIINLT